ncbi:MAG TPA: tyrosine-type recombinase/integrase [Sulfuricurvum sp.]|nr:tyrosine-type recombinase/integrase [Sulfuricurvum sp.]
MSNITKAFTRVASCEKGKSKQEFYDDALKGFMLEIRSNGRKTFFLKAQSTDGKRKAIRIGDAAVLDADAARTKALKLKRAIEEGKEVMLDTPEQVVTLPTMKHFYDEYYLPYVQKHIKSYETNISVFKNHIIPVFGNIQLNHIKKMDIMKVHTEMVHKKKLAPATANKFLIFISHAYHLAIDLELQGITDNPAKGIKPFEENNERQRFITRRESKRLMLAVHQSENIHLKYIVPMLILSGCRRNEVLTAKWKDFDELQMMWTLPVTKNGKKRILPITPQLYEIYKQIPKESNTYLFASPKTKKPYISIYCSWNTARVKAGLPDVRMHDLRHSYASALVNAGRSLYEVQTLLGHSSSKMTQRYAHLSNEALMSAASCAGKLMG